jgi:serine/threonine protein kinase/nitrite reductase/ring-hydroxylating ferredoxin subunit
MNSLSVEHLIGHSLGTYQVEQLLGQSKMNAVYLARHSQHQRMVMLTVFLLPHEYSLQARVRFRERFMQVAATVTTLNHPCILPVYDFGEQGDYPYIVTPLVANTGSLAALLKQQPRLTPTQALEIVRQVAAGLDYAHRQGVIHGALKSTNILLDSEQKVLIAGFGQATILQLRGIEKIPHPYMHLLSIARTFLGAPAYIAPEVVQGMPCDAPADVYALGAMLFEMLSGEPPFAGLGPLTTALQHVERPVPSLLIACPDLPLGLDLVVQQALKRDPAQRYRSAGELVNAFERVLRMIDVARMPALQTRASEGRKSATPFPTLPPDYDWFDEDVAQLEDVAADSDVVESGQMVQLDVSEAGISPQPVLQSQESSAAYVDLAQLDSPEEMSVDPFVWWSTTALTAIQQPDASQQHSDVPPITTLRSQPLREDPARWSRRRKPSVDKGRRRAIAVLAIGGVAFLGALGIDGVMLAQRLQDVRAQAEASGSRQANVATTQPTPTPTEQPAPSPTAQPSPTPTEQPTPTPIEQPRPAPTEPSGPIAAPTEPSDQTPTAQPGPTPTPTVQPSPTPTAQPSPTPGHTGTVIGATSQGTNSSKTFTNPADGKKSLLIHLSNGNFVAFESSCPHEGATCYYDSGSQKITCPRHNAVFDPNNNAAVLQGPAKRPLPAVTVHVNADGTVTVS